MSRTAAGQGRGQCGDFVAEYRRVRDSRGEGLLFVTMRRDTVTPDRHDSRAGVPHRAWTLWNASRRSEVPKSLLRQAVRPEQP